MTIEGVIFDCDGTLVDSETISLKVLVDLVSGLGLDIPHSEAMRRFAGGQLPLVFAEIESALEKPLPDDFLDQFRKRQLAELGQSVEAIDGAHELLSSLKKPFCVASNAPLNKVRLCLNTSGLMEHIPPDQLHSAYDIEVWKPEPDLFLKAAAAINVEPERCAVVEDSRFGIEAGLNAGMHVFALDQHGDLPPQNSSVTVVRSLRELSAHLV